MNTEMLIKGALIIGLTGAFLVFVKWILQGVPQHKSIKKIRKVKKKIRSTNNSWHLEEKIFGGLYGKLITQQGEVYLFVLSYENDLFVLSKVLNLDKQEIITKGTAASIQQWIQGGCSPY